jgi:hypothetical protein
MPLKQRRPQPIFENTDMLADGAMGNTQLACGSLETAETRGSFKGTQGIERWQGTRHSREFF